MPSQAQLPALINRAKEAAGGPLVDGITRGFLAVGNGRSSIGLEVDGCLLDPIEIKATLSKDA